MTNLRISSQQKQTTLVLFLLSMVTALIHLIDNIYSWSLYPELPTSQPITVVKLGSLLFIVGMVGFLLYWNKYIKFGLLMLYVYCLANLIALLHYTPNRIASTYGSFALIPLQVHLTIFLEILFAGILAIYLYNLHKI